MVLVFWIMISRRLVMIRFFLSISQLILYIFTHQGKSIPNFLQFRGGLLTTSNFTFIHYKNVIEINQNMGMSLWI